MSRPASAAAWAVLALLLAALLAGAATFDPRRWPGVVGDEASYLMQAQSLARDGDLRYSRRDFDRFREIRGVPPEGLILQSADGGRTLVYGKPALYAVWLAPFVRLWPAHGPAIANALLLAVAALAAARALSRRLGPAAPLWVAAWVFASVAFAYVFWAHADLFLMCLVAIALALAWGSPEGGVPEGRGSGPQGGAPRDAASEGEAPRRAVPGNGAAEGAASGGGAPESALPGSAALGGGAPAVLAGAPRRRFLLRWAGVGVLLAAVLMARPPYGALLLPAALAVPPGRRRAGLAALFGGAAVAVAALALAGLEVRGTWTSYGGERQAFYSFTGFPEVDLPAGAWAARAGHVSGSWVERQTLGHGFQGKQTAWNVIYFWIGRHVGILPYFLPLLLGLAAYRPGEGRGALLLAVAVAAAVLLVVRPFNFWGGGGSIANRYFLPLYPAFWFLAAGPPRGRRAWTWAAPLAPLVAAALAAPFLAPLWAEPRAYPLDGRGGYRWVSRAAQRLLPYETTQSHLKPSGQEDFLHNGLWVKPLTTALEGEMDGRRLRLAPGEEAQVLFGDRRPLAAVRLRFPPPGQAQVEVDGRSWATTPRPAGGTVVRVPLRGPRARHRMWWTGDFYLYELRLALPPGEAPPPDGLRFQIVPEWQTAAQAHAAERRPSRR